MRDPNLFLCGCEKTPENTIKGGKYGQCRRHKEAYWKTRRKKNPAKFVPIAPRVTAEAFTCGHPRTLKNTIRGGVGFPKGRCRTCRESNRKPLRKPRVEVTPALIAQVQKQVAAGIKQAQIAANLNLAKTTVWRIVVGPKLEPAPPMCRVLPFDPLSLPPRVPEPAAQGRSYSLAPMRRQA